MDTKDAPPKEVGRASRRWIASVALVASGLVTGGILAGTHVAAAESTTSTGTATATSAATNGQPSAMAPTLNGSSPGPGETLLTGSAASKVEAAALEAVPGGTIIRVETDANGSPYEAHVQTSDGSVVTVYVDEDFTVTSTEDGFGPGPQQGPSGQAPSQAPSSSTSA